MVNVPKNIPNL